MEEQEQTKGAREYLPFICMSLRVSTSSALRWRGEEIRDARFFHAFEMGGWDGASNWIKASIV